MTSKVTEIANVSCAVRIPAVKKVTAFHLFAEEQVTTWWCCKKMVFTPIMTITLNTTQCHQSTDTLFEYRDCLVNVNVQKIREVNADCFLKLKVKRGEKTIRKKIVKAKYLIECFQEPNNAFENIHLALDVLSYYPLTVGLKIQTKKTHSPEDKSAITEMESATDNTPTTVAEETGDQSVQAVPETITDQPTHYVPLDFWENLVTDNTSEAATDEEWEDIPLSDDDEEDLQQDDAEKREKHPLQNSQDISCFKGLAIDEELMMQYNDEAAPLESVRVRMWRPVRRVVKLSIFGLLAVTAVMVVLESLLPPLDDDEV